MLITKRQKECSNKVCTHCDDWITVIKCVKCKKYNWIPTCGNKNKSFRYEIGICWNCKERFWACQISDLVEQHSEGKIDNLDLNSMLQSNAFTIKEGSQFPPLWITKVVSMSFDNLSSMQNYTKNDKPINQKKTIFICDDDTTLLQMLSLFLTKYGYNVVTTTCYKELKSQIEQQIPDLLLLDIYLPEHNGYWIQEELEYLGYNIPTILITASDDAIFKNHAPLTDTVERLLKPLDLKILLALIQKYIDTK